ncbi:MAG: efflux RND transporter periplasmic adaptor subunit [Bacteroidota bacterium]|nr:efflux RND transporter periplasmic adaptor subunit [Bacteroidota bacterium]
MINRLFRLTLPLLVLSACGKDENTGGNRGSQELNVEVVLVQSEAIQDALTATGNLRPNEEIDLKSEISGRIISIGFNEGETVRKGQLLVEIENDQYKAQIRRISAQLDQARKNEERASKLLKVEGISQEQYDNTVLRVAELEAQYAETRSILDKTMIRAPFSGTVGLRSVSPGGFVSPGDQIASLVQSDPLKVDFDIPEVFMGQVQVGDTVDVLVSGRPDTLKARVFAIDPRINIQSRSFTVRAKMPNPNHQILPGAFGRIMVNLRSYPNAIIIPSTALVSEINGQSLWVLDSGRTKKVPIETGIRTATGIQITDGIHPGDSVIVTGLLGMRPGIPVKVSKVYSASEALQP